MSIAYSTCRKCGHNVFTKVYNPLTDRLDWTCLGCGFREGRPTIEQLAAERKLRE